MQVLIDPVCMFTIYPQLLRNFIYKLPRLQWDQGIHGMVDCLRYLVARNLVIAEAFGRKFAWHKVCSGKMAGQLFVLMLLCPAYSALPALA